MRITLADIATKANVSKMTVSRVLSGKGQVAEETADKIRDIINEMGYQPNLIARSLASKRTNIIGVIIPKIEHMFLDNYIAQVLSGITDIALKNDYRIMLCPIEAGGEDGNKYLNIARNRILDGMILLKTKINDTNIDTLAEFDFPFVLVNHKKDSPRVNFVDAKNIEGAKFAVQYLYKRGYRNLACIAGNIDETNGIDRLKGFIHELEALNLKKNDNLIVYGNFDKDTAFKASEILFTGDQRPDAVFCCDDYMALGLMERIKLMGLKVPDDIAVIGFDDIDIAAYVKPALTTIRQPLLDLGKTSAQILLDLIEKKCSTPIHKLIDVQLIQRNSA